VSRKLTECGESLDPIQMAGRRLSCETIMFHQSVADRLGLNVTDHKCVDFLILYGPSTAGDLAERSSLTTGAITAVLDRLEKAGFVRREADPTDRRRVIVHPVFERLAEIGMLFEDLAARVQELATRYTKSELDVIADFMNRSCDVLHTAAMNLRAEQPATKKAPAQNKDLKRKTGTRKAAKR
jgi:DNA-binding MarR family transcriptional regulator